MKVVDVKLVLELAWIMSSRPNFVTRLFLILAFACAISVPSTASQASRTNARSSSPDWARTPASIFARNRQEGGRLIVQRTPNFGTLIGLHLLIDGREVADIQWDHYYDGFVSAGEHVLSVLPAPNRSFCPPTLTRLTVRPGHTYVFTATWESDCVLLRRSTLSSGSTQAPSIRMLTR